MPEIAVAVAQIVSRSGEIEANLARLERQARGAAALGADLVLFAETCVHSFALAAGDLARAEPLDGAILARLTGLARELRLVIAAGFLERDGSRIHNSHVAAFPDGRRLVQRKHVLTPPELAAGLSPGAIERVGLRIAGVRCALVICADAGSQAIADDCLRQDVQLRLAPTGGGGPRSEILCQADLESAEGRERYARERQKVFVADAVMPPQPMWPQAFASANALGHDGAAFGWHRGHCLIVDRLGVVRAQIPGTCVLEHQRDQLALAHLSFP